MKRKKKICKDCPSHEMEKRIKELEDEVGYLKKERKYLFFELTERKKEK